MACQHQSVCVWDCVCECAQQQRGLRHAKALTSSLIRQSRGGGSVKCCSCHCSSWQNWSSANRAGSSQFGRLCVSAAALSSRTQERDAQWKAGLFLAPVRRAAVDSKWKLDSISRLWTLGVLEVVSERVSESVYEWVSEWVSQPATPTSQFNWNMFPALRTGSYSENPLTGLL